MRKFYLTALIQRKDTNPRVRALSVHLRPACPKVAALAKVKARVMKIFVLGPQIYVKCPWSRFLADITELASCLQAILLDVSKLPRGNFVHIWRTRAGCSKPVSVFLSQ
jgi:hypothetical protein